MFSKNTYYLLQKVRVITHCQSPLPNVYWLYLEATLHMLLEIFITNFLILLFNDIQRWYWYFNKSLIIACAKPYLNLYINIPLKKYTDHPLNSNSLCSIVFISSECFLHKNCVYILCIFVKKHWKHKMYN